MRNHIYTVGLTGGIGSGKTTFASMLEKRGAAVYYADTRAKSLMVENAALITAIKNLFGAQAYDEQGNINRAYISSRIFSDKTLLLQMNAIVHPAVYADFEHWRLCQEAPYVILESAILYESSGDERCDVTVTVSIPLEERINRTMERDGVSREAVIARINSQMSDQERESRSSIIVRASTLPDKELEAARLDEYFRSEALK